MTKTNKKVEERKTGMKLQQLEKEVKELKKEIAEIKNILRESELTPWAKKELAKARTQSTYTSVDEL